MRATASYLNECVPSACSPGVLDKVRFTDKLLKVCLVGHIDKADKIIFESGDKRVRRWM